MKSNIISVICHQKPSIDGWQVTNDGVMGGLSTGSVAILNQNVIFSGRISTENHGGFTSVFKRLAALSEEITTIRICVIGDGSRYQLRVRSQVQGHDLAYKIDFETKLSEVVTHTFKLADFQASFRGRMIGNAPLLNASIISHLGFLITAKQPQDFSLSLQAIDFYQ